MMNCSTGNTCTLNVLTTDPNFHIGAYYYVILQSSSGQLSMNLKLNQYRQADQIQSGLSYKGTYWTTEEHVKFYYF